MLLLINFMNISSIHSVYFITSLRLLLHDYANTVEDTTQGTDYRLVVCLRLFSLLNGVTIVLFCN